MIQTLLFSGITALLILEGALLSRLILREKNTLLHLSLGLPLAALFNVFIVFDWTILGMGLTPVTLLLEHAVITLILAMYGWKKHGTTVVTMQAEKSARGMIVLEWLCMILLAVIFTYSFIHAVLLPTFQYDSATNWTMRSEISFEDQKIAFDTDEVRGMAKPQYPFLFHALQIVVNQGQPAWNDRAANTVLWLLSLSSFTALFLILRRCMERVRSVLTITMILGIPLLSLHLGQGYADITLLQELILSLVCLMTWIRERKGSWLLLSGLFVTASVWTKSEGLLIGLVPWILAVGTLTFLDREKKKEIFKVSLVAIILSITWPVFAMLKGLPLTPHSADTMLAFHSEGVREAFLGLFDRGSFGIAWYVLLVAVPWMMLDMVRREKKNLSDIVPLAWGLFVLASFLFIYLFTPNVRFLLNAESYYRQMMIPAAMLMLTVCVWFGRSHEKTHGRGDIRLA